MALMVCPDCGTKISDTAEMCIHCGCDLYLYREEIRIEKEIEEKMIAFSERIAQEKPPKQITSLSEIPLYRNQDASDSLMKVIGIGSLATSFLFIISGVDLYICLFLAILGAIFCVVYYFVHSDTNKLLAEEQSRIQQEIDNFETIQSNRIIIYQEVLSRKKKEQLEKIKNRKPLGLRCPVCDSTACERISTLNRVVSVELVGLASSKIGKQYKCQRCGHMW